MKIKSNGKSQNEKYKLLLWCDRKLKSESKRKKYLVFDSQQQKAVRECNSWFTFMHHRKSQHPIFKQTKKNISAKQGLLVVVFFHFPISELWYLRNGLVSQFFIFPSSSNRNLSATNQPHGSKQIICQLSVLFHLICCLNASMDRKSVEDHQQLKTCFH